MYPMTGVIPPKINITQESLAEFKPKINEASLLPPPKELKSVETNTEDYERKEASMQTDAVEELTIDEMEMIISNSEPNATAIIAPPTLFEDDSNVQEIEIIQTSPPKLNVKILNKATQDKVPAKQFKKPSIKIEKIEKFFKPKILNSQINTPKIEETYIETIEETPDGNIQIFNLYGNEEYLEEEVEQDVKPESMDKSEEGVVYTCTVCDRSFPLLQQLEIHKQNHERARDHPCEYCGMSLIILMTIIS
jgi:DNA-directed RNA polymerase subunit RPC12/RpoP